MNIEKEINTKNDFLRIKKTKAKILKNKKRFKVKSYRFNKKFIKEDSEVKIKKKEKKRSGVKRVPEKFKDKFTNNNEQHN